MGIRLFSTKNREMHLGPYPLERLSRIETLPDLTRVVPDAPLDFRHLETPHSLVNAMGEYQAMLDVIRDGLVNPALSGAPTDPEERARHMKAFGYFQDASMMGACRLPSAALLKEPRRNPDIDRLADDIRNKQTKTLASGIDEIMAGLKDSIERPSGSLKGHSHAIVVLVEHNRPPRADEPGAEWIVDAQDHRAALRAAETAVILSNYLQLLGFQACAHTATSSDVDLNRLAVAAGLATMEDGALIAPWLGTGFGLAAITTDMEIAPDRPLAALRDQPWFRTNGPAWWLGKGTVKGAMNRDPYARRNYADGALPFEKLKRVEEPTTFIDEARVARVPKRTDMFARSQFGDLGKKVQSSAAGGWYARKSAHSFAQRRVLGAFVLLQDGDPAAGAPRPSEAERNAANVKAASYFLGVDAVGISRCPDWTWYSHDATGAEIVPPHDQAISMIIDQGYETMEGASGDDWIAVSQSMRAYLRFSLLGGVIAKQIRNLGYSAKAHSVLDGEVLQPPLLLLSGLGEVSRIGEVILNPLLGPRLKSGVVTTDMPLAHDQPIDFGLQNFCENCNKCARECPAGAITAGPKRMFNGYEIWKSDSQKCTTYRVTTENGAMCGRCMKTCPWNLEGLFAEKPFRWVASNVPAAAPALARLDDMVGNGGLNDAKKWWWDLELKPDGGYRAPEQPVNRRDLQRDLDLKYEDQTLAVYPANLAPWPWPYPFPMDREAGIEAYREMISAAEYRDRLERGETDGLAHERQEFPDAPVIMARVSRVEQMSAGVTKYEFTAWDGSTLPDWTAGAHLDVVVTPEYLRQYSMSGDPANTGSYQIGVLREDTGRGGSRMLHRIFREGRRVFISKPINHFDLVEEAEKTFLMGGGIGVTPMIAFAHRLHTLGRDFELHYSASRKADAGFLGDLRDVPWAARVSTYFSDEGNRADIATVLGPYRPGRHVYACGPVRYMDSVMEAATQLGFPDSARHLEYFSVPEEPEYVNHDFTARLARSGREIAVPAQQSLSDALQEAGVKLDVKCSDGICGVCKCGLLEGEVEHRDFVLSKAQRAHEIVTCKSRAAAPNGVIVLDL
ncbi:reductive dehalogenase [Phaeobacter sp. 22II1-1F12B]|uniref:reductive dehalogenase n=1 Tax=Phaeobacter sp. 22II1-1F12B TaxID=1317111 RepID=UPI000B5274DF|nr:reductive dehalogenase [Phaeobacter sp. 22II1-1F12B]OWU79144.1 NAD-binding oxidoreductase [Phaeobacter sp. 22II1-1F12B]